MDIRKLKIGQNVWILDNNSWGFRTENIQKSIIPGEVIGKKGIEVKVRMGKEVETFVQFNPSSSIISSRILGQLTLFLSKDDLSSYAMHPFSIEELEDLCRSILTDKLKELDGFCVEEQEDILDSIGFSRSQMEFFGFHPEC